MRALEPLGFQIGPYSIAPGICLAPMAGQTNRAFRKLCRECGGFGLVTTELLSSQALENKGTRQKSLAHYDWDDQEFPLSVQLYGHHPQTMAEAAKIVVDAGAKIVDINMGCWVPKVVKKGGGAALLSDPKAARTIVEAVIKAVEVPVTVKVRSGIRPDVLTAIPFAKIAQESGVAAITVHGRTAEQGFSGQADWDLIGQVRQAVTIPVIANGDVFSAQDLTLIQQQTGCQGVMLGRATLGAPWIAAQWLGLIAEPNRFERARFALRHLELTEQFTSLPEQTAIRELRGQLSRYHLDLDQQDQLRQQLIRLDSYAHARALLEELALQA
jgi:tRNA-dihydrouridine synthase B